MSGAHKTICDLVDEMRAVTRRTQDPTRIVDALRAPLRAAALEPSWLEDRFFSPPQDQGFGSFLLHVEPDDTLPVFLVSWLPGRGAPPHDHGTWGVVAGVRGEETNINWRRRDDGSRAGYADLEEASRTVLAPGDVITVLPADIHSVVNATGDVTISLHVYGRHLNETKRSRYDVEQRSVSPFVISVR